jgi:tetratricopeptide (TPR) repeat protein
MRILIEDRGIFQLLVPCPMRQLSVTLPECQACPYHGGAVKEHHHFPDDSYVTGTIECRYVDEKVRVHRDLGWSLLRLGRYNESAGEWREALRLDPTALDQNLHAQVQAVDADSEAVAQRLPLAHLLYVQGKPEAAIAQLRAVLARVPEHAEAYWVLGLHCLSLDRWDEAEAAFAEATRLQPVYGIQRHLALAEARYRRDDLDGAHQGAQQALASHPAPWQAAQAYATIGLIHHRGGDLGAAITAYRQALELDPTSVARVNLCAAYFDSRRYAEAERTRPSAMPYLSWAVMYDRLHPLLDSAGRRFLLATYYYQAGLVEDALRANHDALKLAPDFPHPHLSLARLEKARGNPAEAHDHQGSYHRLRGEADAAIREHGEAVRLKPNWAEARYHLGLAYRGKGLVAESIGQLREAARLDPSNPLYRQGVETL